MKQQLIFLELNEINFDFVRDYIAAGKLPNFKYCLEKGSYGETVSEQNYEEIEPWIQWVTAHTGKTLAEHGVFRLGDIVHRDLPQIWEALETKGATVGAISPMNAKNRTRSAAFFLPDPWTDTDVTGSYLVRKLCGAVSQAVKDNAKARVTPASLFWLAAGALVYARPSNYLCYLRLALAGRKKPWLRAMFLDLLLADIFIRLTRSKRPDFVTLFLNAAAHIQHHYLFSSAVYDGQKSNPAWYIDPSADPVLDVYELYDRIIAMIRSSFPDARLMIATGLHQDPHEELTYYWRLLDHGAFLAKRGIRFASVEAKMARDFLVRCDNSDDATAAEQRLLLFRDANGVALFEVDNRGNELFVMLTYPFDIDDDFEYFIDGHPFRGLKNNVAFVAIKNGQHNGIGYFLDLGASAEEHARKFPLAELPGKIQAALAA